MVEILFLLTEVYPHLIWLKGTGVARVLTRIKLEHCPCQITPVGRSFTWPHQVQSYSFHDHVFPFVDRKYWVEMIT